MKTINAELKLTIVFITHEMSVVKKLADRVAVLEGGRIVEQGTTYEIFAHPSPRDDEEICRLDHRRRRAGMAGCEIEA